jgi:ABC-type dipeptide/oligopeptide/nickel transport system permease component
MGWYIGRRLLAALVTVWIVATAGFLLVEVIPGDPARQLAGPGASAATLASIREAYGFDDPLPVRYVDALLRMAGGDLGYSFAKAEPVMSVLLRSLPLTLLLTGLAFLVEVVIAIPLALWVVSRGGLADRLLVIAAGLTAAIPAFLVGLLLIYVFAFRLRWLPLGGAGSPAAYILPVLTLGVPFGLVLARLLRTSLLEQQTQPYITFSEALGERPWPIRWRHLLPNALLPLLSILALDFAGLFSSVAVVEAAFSMPGLGTDLLLGLRRLDTALIVGIGIIAGLLVALVNLLADVAVIAIDPRVRR